MCLVSQEMRKLAPELDPLRIGTGWKKEDLGKVQVMVESTYGDSHPEADILTYLWKRFERELLKKADSEQGTIVQIYAMVKVRELTVSIIALQAGK